MQIINLSENNSVQMPLLYDHTIKILPAVALAKQFEPRCKKTGLRGF